MYCINCGKEVEGNIPICGGCLQGILDKYRAEQDLIAKVEEEAIQFHPKDGDILPNGEEYSVDEETESQEREKGDGLQPKGDPSEDMDIPWWIIVPLFIAIVLIVICVTFLSIR